MKSVNSTDNEIDKAAFLLLSEEDLKTLLPTKLGPRKKIWALIEGLQNEEQAGTNIKEISASSSETSQPQQTVNDITPVHDNSRNYSPVTTQATSSYTSEEREHNKASTLNSNDIVAKYMQTDHFDSKYTPVTALTKFSSEACSKAHSSFYENAAETIQSFVDPLPSHSDFNRLSLNVQFVNHNQLSQTYHSVPEANPFACKEEVEIKEETERERHDADEKVHRRPAELRSVKASHKHDRYNDDKGKVVPSSANQIKRADGRKKNHHPTSKKVPIAFKKSNQLPIYQYKNEFLKVKSLANAFI